MVDLRSFPCQAGAGDDGLLVRSAIVVLVILGAALRVLWTGSQIVAGDEIHPLLHAAEHTAIHVLTHFAEQDHCIPITLWCKLLQATVGLEEWGMRLPAFLPGTMLVLVVAHSSRFLLRGGDRVLLVLVVALSSLLVYWSREARPYSLVTLLSLLAALALARFGTTGERRWGLASAACQALLLWCSPTTLPFVVGLAAGACVSASGGGAGRSALRLALPGLFGCMLATLLTLPALPSLLDVISSKTTSQERVGATTLLDTLRLLTGAPALEPDDPRRFAVLAPALLGAFGLFRLAARRPRVAVAFSLVVVFPALTYALVPVASIAFGHVYARYQAGSVPFLLALPVLGLAELRDVVGRGTLAGRALLGIAAASAVLVAGMGPLANGLPPRQPFGLQSSRMNLTGLPREQARAECVSVFYREIAARRGDSQGQVVLVEWPAREPNRRLLAMLQSVHGARIIRCWPLGSEPQGFALRTILFGFVAVDRRAPRGTLVVLHKAPDRELVQVETCAAEVGSRDELPAAIACRHLFGEPVYEDEWIVVFRTK